MTSDPRPAWALAIDVPLQIVLGAALLGELAVVFAGVVSRSLLGSPLVWTDEAARMSLSTMAFLGGALAYRRGEHAFIRTLVERLPPACQRVGEVVVALLILTVSLTTGVTAIPFLITQRDELTPVLQIRASWFVLPLVIAMFVLALTAVERLVRLRRSTVLRVGAAFAALAVAAALTRDLWRPWLAGEAALALSLALFFLIVIMGLPVAFALLLGAFGYLYAAGTVPMAALAHTMINGISNFVLLALPFFVLAAVVMNHWAR